MLRRFIRIILFSVFFFSLSGVPVVRNATGDLLLTVLSVAHDEIPAHSLSILSLIESENEPGGSHDCVSVPVVVVVDLRPVRIKGFTDIIRQVSLHGARFFSPIAGVTSLPDIKQLYGDESRWITLKSLLC